MNQIEQTLNKIKDILLKELSSIGASNELIHRLESDNIFDIPEPSHGDYTTNVAMVCAKELKMSPRELAEKLVASLRVAPPQNLGRSGRGIDVAQFEIAGPGFINITLGSDIRLEYLKNISYRNINNLKNKSNDRHIKSYVEVNSKWTDKRVLIEYTDPNPFKIFHIGHLVQNTAGESASRLLEIGGANLRRLCYQGDVGMHVAKTIWGMRHLDKTKYKDYTEWYNAGYVYGSTKWTEAEGDKAKDESQQIIEEIKTLNKDIYKLFTDDSSTALMQEYKSGYDDSMKQFENMYVMLGTQFDEYIRESVTGNICLPIVKSNTGVGKIFIESDGAIVNNVDVTGMHTRVFINSQGLPTYEAKDIGNFQYKLDLSRELYNGEHFDYSIVSTGNEIDEYFKLINKVIGLIYPEYSGKQIHISNGMLRLTTGKMSSRKGSVVPATEMIDDMASAIWEKRRVESDINKSIDEENKYKYLGINAFKFSFLKQAMGKDVIYDREKAIDVNGDSGMYVNYTYARVTSLLAKAKALEYNISFAIINDKGELKNINYSKAITEIANLERVLSQYDYIMNRAIDNLEPHRVAQYALDVCHAVNKFYNDNKVLDNNRSKEETEYILAVLDVSRTILESVLYALGMRAIESV